MKYFVGEYITYYDRFNSDKSLPGKANSVLENAQAVINQYDAVVSYTEAANWSGEAKNQIINTSLPQLRNRIDILKNNVSGSLVPASETAIYELLDNLEEMEAKDKLLDKKEDSLKTANANKAQAEKDMKNASDYICVKGQDDVYTGEKAAATERYNGYCEEITNLTGEIEQLNVDLKDLVSKCNDNIKAIKKLNGDVTKFDGTNKAGLISDIEGLENWQSTFFEKDGVFYQIPYIKYGDSIVNIEPQYIICIDMNEFKQMLTETYGNDPDTLKSYMDICDKFENHLKEKVSNSNNETYLSFETNANGNKTGTGENTRKVLSLLLDQMLENSYVKNNATTAEEYATVAAVVTALNPLVTFGYRLRTNIDSEGYDKIINGAAIDGKSRGTFDCENFIYWSYYQGLKKVYKDTENKVGGYTINKLMSLSTEKLVDLNKNGFTTEDIVPGSLVTKYAGSNRHIGIVIGKGVDANGNETILIAQASGGPGGGTVIVKPYLADVFFDEWVGKSKNRKRVKNPTNSQKEMDEAGFISVTDFVDLMIN